MWKKSGTLRATALAAFVLSGLLLRTCGLSHDLDQGHIYHPDTPKQAAAAQQFLDFRYVHRVGNLNYDGYPFFNSHLATWLYRALSGVASTGAGHLGIDASGLQPDITTFIWIIRFMNAVLSALAIAVGFHLTRAVFGRRAAWVAAAMIMLSPLDIMTCHFAMGDTTAAFFALVTCWTAVACYREKKLWLYAVCGAALALAFSAKYHAAIAVAAPICAHLCRFPRPASWIRREFWQPVLPAAAGFLVALLCANPALLVAPGETLQNIWAFMGYTSNFGMSESLRAMPLHTRWLFGITHNLGSFIMAVTLPTLLLAPLGLLTFFRRRPTAWIMAAPLLLYMLVALPFKPLAHPQYHTVVLPLLIILGAGTLVRLFELPRAQPICSGLTLILAAFILFRMQLRTSEVNFYFQRADTRLIAEQWVDRNVPDSFQAAAGHYTLVDAPPEVDHPRGRVMLSSSFRPHRAPAHPQLHTRIDLKDDLFASFRNPAIDIFLHNSPWLSDDVQPVNLWPAPAPQSRVILSDVPDFRWTPRMVQWRAAGRQARFIMSDEPLRRLRIVFKNGGQPNRFRIKTGSDRIKQYAPPWSTHMHELELRHTAISHRGGRYIYRINLISRGPACALLAVNYRQSVAATRFAGRDDWNLFPDREQEALLTSSLSAAWPGDSAPRKNPGEQGTDWMDDAGTAPAYWRELPPEVIHGANFSRHPAADIGWLSSPWFPAPGVYRIDGRPDVEFIAADTGRPLTSQTTNAGRFIQIPPGTVACRLRATTAPRPDDHWMIRPDIEQSIDMKLSSTALSEDKTGSSFVSTDTRFEGGIRLLGYYAAVLNKNGTSFLMLNPGWDLSRCRYRAEDIAVWVHARDAKGNIIQQFDHPLLLDSGLRPETGPVDSVFFTRPFAADVDPAGLTLSMGLYIPMQQKRLDVNSSNHPVEQDGIILKPVKTLAPR